MRLIDTLHEQRRGLFTTTRLGLMFLIALTVGVLVGITWSPAPVESVAPPFSLTPEPTSFFSITPVPLPTQDPNGPDTTTTALNIWVNRGEGGRYRIGETIQVCYTVPRAGNMRIIKITSQGTSTVLQGRDDGRGGCFNGTAGAPTGQHTLRIEMLDGVGYNEVAQTYYYVDSSGGTGSISIRVDRGQGSSYRIGDAIQVCYTVPRAGNMRILTITSQGTSTFLQGRDDGRGGCVNGTVGAPTGQHTLRIEMLEGGSETAQTYFNVTGTPISIRVDRGQGATYHIGDAIQVCYTVPRSGNMRIIKTTSGGTSTVREGRDDGTGGCFPGVIGAPTGWHTLRIEMLEGGNESAETYYFVTQNLNTQPPEGMCRVRWVAASSSCTGDFGLYSPRRQSLISNYSTQQPGTVVDFGPFTPGTSLVFYLNSPTQACGSEFLSTSINARITENGINNWRINWEDLPANRTDSDYNDLVVEIECGLPLPCNPGSDGVVLYEHPNYQGRCLTLTGDDPDLNDNSFGDIASSIEFRGSYTSGWEAILYEHTYYSGASSTFQGSDSDLGNNTIGHDRTSSVKIQRQRVVDAAFVSQSAYPTVYTGQAFQIYFEVRNTGNTTWRSSEDYYLGNFENSLGTGYRRELSYDVSPGATHRFNIDMVAPTTPGTYRTAWRMKYGPLEFGPYMYQDVTVLPIATFTPTPTWTRTLTPRPVSTITTTPTPSPTRTRTPTPTLTPLLPGNPLSLRTKLTLVHYLENPSFQVLGFEVPSDLTQYLPAWGYNEDAIVPWLDRFQQPGYSSGDYAALQRAVLGENAAKEYYKQSLEVGDGTARAIVEAISSIVLVSKGIDHVENALRNSPDILREQIVAMLQFARKLANDILRDVTNWWIDAAIDKRQPLNAGLKKAILIFIDKKLSRVEPRLFFDDVVKEAGRALGDYAFAYAFVFQTQGSINEVAQKARDQQYRGTYEQASTRLNGRLSQSQADTRQAVQSFETALSVAGFGRTVSEIGALTAIFSGGVSPISAAAQIATIGGTIVNFTALGVSMRISSGRWVNLDDELQQATRLAFDPDYHLLDHDARLAHEKLAAIKGYPLGLAPDTTTALTVAIQDYNQILSQIEAAIRANRVNDVVSLMENLKSADEQLFRQFTISRAPIQAAILEVGRTNPGFTTFSSSVDEVTRTGMVYLTDRFQLHMNLIAYIMQGGGGGTTASLNSLNGIRVSIPAYEAAIQTARNDSGTITIPGYVLVTGQSIAPTQPIAGRPLTVLVSLQNVGGAAALDVDIDVSVTEPLRLQSPTRYSYSTIDVGQTRTLALELYSAQSTDSYLNLIITSRSSQTVVEQIPVQVSQAPSPTPTPSPSPTATSTPKPLYLRFLPVLVKNQPVRNIDSDDGVVLVSGQTISGSIEPASDDDTLYFEAQAGQRATIRMSRTSDSLDSLLALFGPDDALIAQDDDSGGGVDALIERVALPYTGRYRILARSFGHYSVGSYTLNLRLEP